LYVGENLKKQSENTSGGTAALTPFSPKKRTDAEQTDQRSGNIILNVLVYEFQSNRHCNGWSKDGNFWLKILLA
jgi:hypothetical protein